MGKRYIPLGPEGGKEGDSFLSFLGKLEWIRDAELENMHPFDVGKLRTPHLAYLMKQGAFLALTFHSSLFLAVFFLTTASLFFSQLRLLIPLAELFALFVKAGVPVWLVRKFVTFDKGLSTEMIKFYVLGYSLTSFVLDLFSLAISSFLFLTVNVFYQVGYDFYDKWIYPLISEYINLKLLGVIALNMIFADPLPLAYFYHYRKKRKQKIPPWIPLDTIPEE